MISNKTTQELQSSQEISSAVPLIVLYSAPVHQRDLAADHQRSTRTMLPWRTSEKAVNRDLPSVALFLGFEAVDIHGLPLVHGPLAHFCASFSTHAVFATSTPASTSDPCASTFAQNPRFLTSPSKTDNNRNVVFLVPSSCSHPVHILSSGQPISTRLQDVRVPSGWFSSATSPSDFFLSLLRHERRMHQEKCLVCPLQRLTTEEQASPGASRQHCGPEQQAVGSTTDAGVI